VGTYVTTSHYINEVEHPSPRFLPGWETAPEI
jgi:hypothetical protein